MEDETLFAKSFKTFEASDYYLIATVDTLKNVLGLALIFEILHLVDKEQDEGQEAT